MEKYVKEFMAYIEQTRHMSHNTIQSYRRDLLKLCGYLEQNKVLDVKDVTNTNLNSYILKMEQEKLAPASISRAIAAIRAFFSFLDRKRYIDENIALDLRAPKVTKKKPEILSPEEIEKLLAEPKEDSIKEIRDKAMLELLYATGIRVSELLTLTLDDVNLDMGYITPGTIENKRVVPMDSNSRCSLANYIVNIRPQMVKNKDKAVFVNCQGNVMSRQGFWKLLKAYALRAGIRKDITPHMIRHSFASHLVENGADLVSVQKMLGYSDVKAASIYFQDKSYRLNKVYEMAHKRNILLGEK